MKIRFIDPAQLTGIDASIFELMTEAATSQPRLTGEQAEDGFARFIGDAITRVWRRADLTGLNAEVARLKDPPT